MTEIKFTNFYLDLCNQVYRRKLYEIQAEHQSEKNPEHMQKCFKFKLLPWESEQTSKNRKRQREKTTLTAISRKQSLIIRLLRSSLLGLFLISGARKPWKDNMMEDFKRKSRFYSEIFIWLLLKFGVFLTTEEGNQDRISWTISNSVILVTRIQQNSFFKSSSFTNANTRKLSHLSQF